VRRRLPVFDYRPCGRFGCKGASARATNPGDERFRHGVSLDWVNQNQLRFMGHFMARKFGSGEQNIVFDLNQEVKWWAL